MARKKAEEKVAEKAEEIVEEKAEETVEKDDKLAVADKAPIDTGEHAEIRQRVQDNRRKVEEAYWELGRDLFEIYDSSLYMKWGFGNWRDFVEKELDFQVRKAQYLLSIFQWFGEMEPNVQKWIKELGWTKAKELVNVVTAENAAEWQSRVHGKSVAEIIDLIKGKPESEDEGGEDEEGGDGSAGSGKEKSSKPKKYSFSWYDDDADIAEKAIAKAMQVGETDDKNKAASIVFLDYLSTNVGVDDPVSYFDKIQKNTSLRIVAFAADSDEIVYGGELLDQLMEDEEEEEGTTEESKA